MPSDKPSPGCIALTAITGTTATGRSSAPLLPPLGVAPAGETAEREHQHAAQHHVIDHHQGVCGCHTICSHGSALATAAWRYSLQSAASMCDTPQARHSKI